MEIVPIVFAAVVVVGFFALFIRTDRELIRQKDAIIASKDATIAKRDAEIVNCNDYVDILRGEKADLATQLARIEGTWTAPISEAKRRRELEGIEHPAPDGLNENGTRTGEPPADWVDDDEQ